MKVQSMTGLSRPVAGHRQDAVLVSSPMATARRQVFQAKLASATKQVTKTNQPNIAPRASSKPVSGDQVGTRTAEAKPGVARNATNRMLVNRQGVSAAQAQMRQAIVAQRRIRRFKKALPKTLRSKVFRLAGELGLSLVDAWCDQRDRSITLVVDQQGRARTKFVIDCEGLTWQVSVRADIASETNHLLAEETALQARFDAADLGHVSLSKAGDSLD